MNTLFICIFYISVFISTRKSPPFQSAFKKNPFCCNHGNFIISIKFPFAIKKVFFQLIFQYKLWLPEMYPKRLHFKKYLRGLLYPTVANVRPYAEEEIIWFVWFISMDDWVFHVLCEMCLPLNLITMSAHYTCDVKK